MNNFNIVGNHILFNSYFKELYGVWTRKPSNDVTTRLNKFANKLTEIGVLQDLSCFYLFYNQLPANNYFNWVNPTKYNLTPSGTIHNRGFDSSVMSDATTGYFDTGFNPSTDPTKYTLNDCLFGITYTSGVNGSGVQLGAYDGTYRAQLTTRSGGSTRVYANSTVQTNTSGAGNYTGVNIAIKRISSTQYELWRGYTNGAATVSQNSAGVPNQTFYLLANNENGTAGSFSVNATFLNAAYIGKCTFDMVLFGKLMNEFYLGKSLS